MEYQGRYKIFDPAEINTYPIAQRRNKVKLDDLLVPEDILSGQFEVSAELESSIEAIAEAVVSSRNDGKPVIIFTGAHLIKNGLGRILIELVKRDMVTLIAGNAATAIHDFELALIGETSEYVPQALAKGQFGMAFEFCYQNIALTMGNQRNLGYGESLGKMICEESFRREVLAVADGDEAVRNFLHPEVSVLAACYHHHIPFTVHAGMGTEVIDQHPSFDGQAKGGCSARDFLIYVNEVTRLTEGGVVLNIGSAVTGPEVFLKAASMSSNIGKVPDNIITADFDMRFSEPAQMKDESAQGYYFRDMKSVVTRIPQAFNGKGYYIQGNQKQTVPLLFKKIMNRLNA